MKKSRKTRLTALMFAAAALTTGCQNPIQDDLEIQEVYGPGPEESVTSTAIPETTTETAAVKETTTAAPTTEATTAEETTMATSEETVAFETTEPGSDAEEASPAPAPDDRSMAAVYGPPPDDLFEDETETGEEEMLTDDESVAETLKPTEFPAVVYGPPNDLR